MVDPTLIPTLTPLPNLSSAHLPSLEQKVAFLARLESEDVVRVHEEQLRLVVVVVVVVGRQITASRRTIAMTSRYDYLCKLL